MSAPDVAPNTGQAFYVRVPLDPHAFPPDADLEAEAREIARRYLVSTEFLRGREQLGELELVPVAEGPFAPFSHAVEFVFRGWAK